jgi:hypothetical protein
MERKVQRREKQFEEWKTKNDCFHKRRKNENGSKNRIQN